ncbi:MAG TPA: DegQ family serine endoprotease [Geobacteraceae bacterium]|nr:DegQ family serine endoprotease [Geobacteraceae bacterium]
MIRNRLIFLLLLAVCALPACGREKEKNIFYETGKVESPVKDVPKDILATQQAFTNLVKVVTPSVVNISTISKKKLVQPFIEISPFFGDLFEEMPSRPRYRKESSLGSGIIINKDGYIITNDHVVRDAESIQVKLSNESIYDAKVVGSDPKSDIAVIRINSIEPLPVAVLGDSDKLQVGQWAIAIGNPFGLDRTVTVGVVSATGRSNMGIETYENFIQTDASINPGNSGGPLLNVNGEVIGINTAIVAAGQGIGFAIPVNMAKRVVEQLIKKGSVTRAWLGVAIQPVTEDIAASFGLQKAKGALISDVMAGSPAEKAGLRQGDILISFDGKEIKDARQLQLVVAETPIGKSVVAEIFRDGKLQKFNLQLASGDSKEATKPRPAKVAESWLGLEVDELPRSKAQSGISGVIVTAVEPESTAASSGLQRGDIITSVNQRRTGTLKEYEAAMKDAEKRGSVALLVRRGNASIYFALKLR